MEWQAWFVLVTIVLLLIVLALEKAPPDLVMLSSLVLIWIVGIIPTDAFLKGFSSSGLATVGALFVVVKGVDASGAVDRAFRLVLGTSGSPRMARARICFVMFFLSGFFNNTPLVALVIPMVRDWCRSRNLAPSQFLLPIDFATVMGGLITMIGTSTNLQVNDFLSQRKQATFNFLEPGYVGAPVGFVSILIMLALSDRCLPNNKGGLFRELRENGDNLVTALEIIPGSRFAGKKVIDMLVSAKVPASCLLKIRRPLGALGPETIGRAGDAAADGKRGLELQGDCLEDVNLSAMDERTGGVESDLEAETVTIDIDGAPQLRSSSSLPSLQTEVHPMLLLKEGMTEIFPVPPGELARVGDTLLLSMSREEVVQLVGVQGAGSRDVRVSSIHASEVVGPGSEFVEVVLSLGSPLVGQCISRGPELFDSHYHAGLVAIRQRGATTTKAPPVTDATANGQLMEESSPPAPVKPMSTTFSPGDTVMLVAQVGADLPSSDFLMVTRVAAVPPPRRPYDYVPLVLFSAGLCIAAAEVTDMLNVAVVLLLVYLAGGWVKVKEYAEIIDWRLLILIGASTGMSEAMSRSGLSKQLAAFLKDGGVPRSMILPLLFTLEVIITEIVTNNAAVAIGLPLALDLAKVMNLKSHKPLTMAVLLGASTGYAMPMGYATHLMVMGPGGYNVKDFLKMGIIVDIVWIIGVSLLLPLVYPMD